MMNDRGKSFNSGGAEFQRRELAARRLIGLKDGADQTVPFCEWATEVLADPEVRYRDNVFKAWRLTVYERFEDAFLDSRSTVEDLAKQAHVSPTTIRSLLERRAMPRREVIAALSSALGKPASYFFD